MGNIASQIEPISNGQKLISNEQMRKLIDNSQLGWPESKSAEKLQRIT